MKFDFTYYNPTRIHFGKDALSHLEGELSAFGKNVLLIYGKGAIKKHGIYDKVVSVRARKVRHLTRHVKCDKHSFYLSFPIGTAHKSVVIPLAGKLTRDFLI